MAKPKATTKAPRTTKTPKRPVSRWPGYQAGVPIVNAATGRVTGYRPRTTPSGPGYQPSTSKPRSGGGGQMNPIQKLLTPGSGGIAAAMTGGLTRKKGVLR